MVARAQNNNEKENFFHEFIHGLRLSTNEKLEQITGYIN
jgi:hypothetical protein